MTALRIALDLINAIRAARRKGFSEQQVRIIVQTVYGGKK
jgi:hypothetical protein